MGTGKQASARRDAVYQSAEPSPLSLTTWCKRGSILSRSGPIWLFSLVLGLAGALLGYLIFTVWIGIGDTDAFDLGGIIGAIIGVIILLPFVGIATRFLGTKST